MLHSTLKNLLKTRKEFKKVKDELKRETDRRIEAEKNASFQSTQVAALTDMLLPDTHDTCRYCSKVYETAADQESRADLYQDRDETGYQFDTGLCEDCFIELTK